MGWRVHVLASLVGLAAFLAVAALADGERLRRAPPGLTAEEEGEVLGALVAFHRVYQHFFATAGSAALLNDFPATRGTRHLVFTDLGFLREAGLVQVQDLASATVVETRAAGPDAAEALVYEEWNYVCRRIADRAVASELKGMGQGFRYTLRRVDGRWLVAGWRPEDIEAPAPDSGFTW